MSATTQPMLVQRHYPKGTVLHLDVAFIAIIRQGVIVQNIIHANGIEVLLGFYGPGQLLVPHPIDDCYIQLEAHTEVSVEILPWTEMVHLPNSANLLRQRIWLQEAWAAVQAHPANEDRLLGILSLLTEQFGVATADGTLLDLRITHQQLANAIGITRPTITRLLNNLRRRQLLSTTGVGNQERFLLHAHAHTSHL